jgi:hypothetical protein
MRSALKRNEPLRGHLAEREATGRRNVAQQRPAMTMGAYLAEVRHAVEGLLPLIWQEQDTLSGRKEQLAERKAELGRLERQVNKEYENAAWLLNNPEWDDEGIGTLSYWDNYFGPDKERYHLGQRIPGMQAAVESAEASVEAHRFSIDVLASTVIQIAKQGMSVVHSRKPAGTGRPIGSSQHLSEVVWEARNQGAHWEERNPFPAVVACFTALAGEVDQVFGDFRIRNVALDVIAMLGWRTFEDFERDMLSLGEGGGSRDSLA